MKLFVQNDINTITNATPPTPTSQFDFAPYIDDGVIKDSLIYLGPARIKKEAENYATNTLNEMYMPLCAMILLYPELRNEAVILEMRDAVNKLAGRIDSINDMIALSMMKLTYPELLVGFDAGHETEFIHFFATIDLDRFFNEVLRKLFTWKVLVPGVNLSKKLGLDVDEYILKNMTTIVQDMTIIVQSGVSQVGLRNILVQAQLVSPQAMDQLDVDHALSDYLYKYVDNMLGRKEWMELWPALLVLTLHSNPGSGIDAEGRLNLIAANENSLSLPNELQF